jgi:hypothetical protein
MTRARGRSRSVSALASRIQLRIFAEGKQTECLYLNNWHRIYRERVIVSIAPHEYTSPFELVGLAVSQRQTDFREARRGRGRAFDEYWCMFDVDEHPKIPDALQLAASNDINVALSSPCLELWFLIHFVNHTAYIDRREAQRQSKAVLGCDKVLDQSALDRLVENYELARSRALELTKKHFGDGSAKPWNPDSGVWKLVGQIREPGPSTSSSAAS